MFTVRTKLLVLVMLLILFAFGTYVLLTIRTTDQLTLQEPVVAEQFTAPGGRQMALGFLSEIPELAISYPIAEDIFDLVLGIAEITGRGFFVLETHDIIHPDSLTFVFRDIDSTYPQDRTPLPFIRDSEGNLQVSFSAEYLLSNNEIRNYIYLDMQSISGMDDRNLSAYLSSLVGQFLVISNVSHGLSEKRQQLDNLFFVQGREPLFWVIRNQNQTGSGKFLHGALTFLISNINVVSAQSCSGGFQCGTMESQSDCGSGDGVCAPNIFGVYICQTSLEPCSWGDPICTTVGVCTCNKSMNSNGTCSDSASCGVQCFSGHCSEGMINNCSTSGPLPTPTSGPAPTSQPGECNQACGGACSQNSDCCIPAAINQACVIPVGQTTGNCWDGAVCGGGTNRIVGRVIDVATGTTRFWQRADNSCGAYQTDSTNTLTVSNSAGASSSWDCNPEPYYSRSAASSGEGPHSFVLSPPPGSSCVGTNWQIDYPLGYNHSSFSSNPNCTDSPGFWICLGTGCNAVVYLGSGDWDNHLTWRVPLAVSCTIDYPDGTYDPYYSYTYQPAPLPIQTGGTIASVTFGSSNLGTAQASAPSGSVNATLTTFAPGTAQFAITATMDDGVTQCTASDGGPITSVISVNNTPPWWQAYGGSLWANGGSINSITSSTLSGAFPLHNLIFDGNTLVTAGVAAATGLVVNPVSQSNRRVAPVTSANLSNYTFSNYYERLGSPTTTNANSQLGSCTYFKDTDYELCYSNGNLAVGTSGAIDLGTRKVVLLVNGDLAINNQINLTKGFGFFMVIASGDINVAATIGSAAIYPPVADPHLEGIFMAFDDFVTVSDGSDDDLQIRIRGSVIALDEVTLLDDRGIALERSLADNTVGPAEVFEFAPDLTLRFPRFLSPRQVSWREIAP